MTEPQEVLARIESLIQIGLRLAMNVTSGRIVLAKAAANLDPSWIPAALAPSLGAALERAAASAPDPLALPEVMEILCSAWKVKRVSAELDSLDPEPAAVTFTAQVHRAVREGEPVAVKVLRPGIAATVRQDLALLDALSAPLNRAFPGLDPAALLTEARERAMDELDLENEAQLMRRFHRALRDGPVVVPAPVIDLCTEQVLVSSWLEGTPLSRAENVDHDATAAALVRFVVGGVREGLVHCDLDADDVLALSDGRLGVVDFGAATTIDRARADLALDVIDAYLAADAEALGTALVGLGLLAPDHGELALAVASAVLPPLDGPDPVRLDAAAVAALLRRVDALDSGSVELLAAARLVPGDLYPARGVGQLAAVIARLGASGIWRDQLTEALRRGWRA